MTSSASLATRNSSSRVSERIGKQAAESINCKIASKNQLRIPPPDLDNNFILTDEVLLNCGCGNVN